MNFCDILIHTLSNQPANISFRSNAMLNTALDHCANQKTVVQKHYQGGKEERGRREDSSEEWRRENGCEGGRLPM